MDIRLTYSEPAFYRPRRTYVAEQDIIDATVKYLLSQGIIRPNKSNYASATRRTMKKYLRNMRLHVEENSRTFFAHFFSTKLNKDLLKSFQGIRIITCNLSAKSFHLHISCPMGSCFTF